MSPCYGSPLHGAHTHLLHVPESESVWAGTPIFDLRHFVLIDDDTTRLRVRNGRGAQILVDPISWLQGFILKHPIEHLASVAPAATSSIGLVLLAGIVHPGYITGYREVAQREQHRPKTCHQELPEPSPHKRGRTI
jgi:hypothetical protein